MNRDKILKMVVILAAIIVIAGSLSRLLHRDSLTLTEYENLQSASRSEEPGGSEAQPSGSGSASPSHPKEEGNAPSQSSDGSQSPSGTPSQTSPDDQEASGSLTDNTAASSSEDSSSSLPQSGQEPQDTPDQPTGAVLNGTSMLEQRYSLTDDFYYEPISDKLQRYMTGISYPDTSASEDADQPEIGFDELRYVHILHYDFEGNVRPGELICNEYIAQDVTEIFYELYRNEYRLERVSLIDEYDGDDEASMEANNTSCFNYRPVTNNAVLSMHAYGLAVDINPLYNPYIAYLKDGSQEVLPASAQPYADRSVGFPYKIDDEDLSYKLFTQHGFIWGGNWNNVKDYQHFQKPKP